ncbi:adenosylcobinamide-phosphate synthase [Bacillus sp. M6-12]|uniref:adenosylcobinamide-phosphate synthase CbiB n=1 Tax=Bacillus sp. M6-12 TaxID=2054166 RepID=UPI000C76AFFF|nr:adenosylcobinamide-phosphate synthase CbiB [Bacillus sp. M6-12]PLS15016.1 adenosylcobinamide-phosphate synthase [Bacillus sp. M6-12]
MIIAHLSSITIAYVIDLLLGDPPNWPHPVRWIGSLISHLEKKLNHGKNQKRNGILMLSGVLIVAGVLTFITVYIAYEIHFIAGMVWEAIVISTAIAQKSLKGAALEVYRPLDENDITTARRKLSYIVGRDTETLEKSEIVRGAVETVAENTNDGITAPLFWALIGGAPLAMVYRAINTCDSMVGYKNERYQQFGWASAKLDDAANWIPSRLTSFMMMVSMKPKASSRKQAWSILFRDARRHPSPNSGWGEAAVASLLGIQLGGLNYYRGMVSDRAKMGDPLIKLDTVHIKMANTLMHRAVFGFIVLLWIGGMLVEAAFSWF